MKKKLTVNTLAFGNLRARKKQYSLMIIGIILAMTFSAGVLFFISCRNSSVEEIRRGNYGCQNAIIVNAQDVDFEQAKQNEQIGDYGTAHIVGFVDGVINSDIFSIAWLDEKALQLSYAKAEEGRLPEKIGEIAIEKVMLLCLGFDEAKIGDEITLNVQTPNGNEIMPQTVKKSYTLVGILKNKRSNISAFDGIPELTPYSNIPTAVVCSDEQVEAGGKESLTYYVTLSDGGEGYSRYNSFIESNSEKLAEGGAIFVSEAGSGNFFSSIYSESEAQVAQKTLLAVVLAGVLTLASCMGIVNAFNTNLQERKKQIGMLRAVGTTRRQIVSIFGREALIICIISTPVSLALSYFSVRFIAGMMGDDFIFIPSWWVLIACGAAGVVCVMLASLIPLARAAKVSPMQAIRNVELSRKMKNKRVRSQQSFSAPALLAKRNLLFGRARQVCVSVILIITIVLSCFAFSYTQYMQDEFYNTVYDYQILPSGGTMLSQYINYTVTQKGSTENDKAKILSSPYVASVVGTKRCFVNILVDEYSDYLDCIDMSLGGTRYEFPWNADRETVYRDFLKKETDYYLENKQALGYTKEILASGIVAIDADELLKTLQNHVVDGEINIDKINSGEEVIVYAPRKVAAAVGFDKKTGMVTSAGCHKIKDGETVNEETTYLKTAENDFFHAGDVLELSLVTTQSDGSSDESIVPADSKRIDKKVKIGAVVENEFDYFWYGSDVMIYTSHEGLRAYPYDTVYNELRVMLKSDCTAEVDSQMMDLINSIVAGRSVTNVYSKFSAAQQERDAYRAMFTMMISVIILFFTVCACLINNSLSARIREGKQEIGTLRAVGASARELNRSYVLQLLSMFGWGCGGGFALYSAIYAVVLVVCKHYGVEIISFEIWQAALICLLLFTICSVNLRIKIKKQMKFSIVENIKEL